MSTLEVLLADNFPNGARVTTVYGDQDPWDDDLPTIPNAEFEVLGENLLRIYGGPKAVEVQVDSIEEFMPAEYTHNSYMITDSRSGNRYWLNSNIPEGA